MNDIEEGVKPQLVLVADTGTALTPTYSDHLIEIIKELSQSKLEKKPLDPVGAMRHLDRDQDNTVLRDWLANNGVMSKVAFDKVLNTLARNRAIEADLGFVPKDAKDFVCRYAKEQNVTLNARGTITRNRSYAIGTEHVTAKNADTSAETRLVYDVANAEGDNLDSYGRELRLITDRLGLGYRDSVLGDALQVWQEETTRDIKVNAMLSIQFAKGAATGTRGSDMWDAMERACFNVTDTAPGFAIAIVKKFIWQVKRKARGMNVTNHLMPVLTGAQGKGKTEFVKAMTLPLHDLMREVNFEMLTDGKTTDIWGSLILFIDEMGYFTKADVDQVKNVITTTDLSIRTMRQNNSAVIRNAATLIGCSNKSLGQLIRDETGVRRFAELEWRNDPDWDASNALDWNLLWQSVDENGSDPVIAANMVDMLKAQQEANRNQSPIEIWVREYAHTFDKPRRAQDLHSEYRTWEQEAFPRQDTNMTMFGKTLTNLISTIPGFPLEKKQDRNGVNYRYVKGL